MQGVKATAAARLLPLSELPGPRPRALFTDIDDTLTNAAGRLDPTVYGALADLTVSGVAVVPVTGRSAGWGHMISRLWPVSGVIAESGAVAWVPEARASPCLVFPGTQPIERPEREALRDELSVRLTRLSYADDDVFRVYDLAFDHSERGMRLNQDEIAILCECLVERGYTVSVSSIHVNAWRGGHTKGAMMDYLCARYPERLGVARHAVVVGDAQNDESLFARAERSVLVANGIERLATMGHRPRFRTESPRGDGFLELARAILAMPTGMDLSGSP